MKSIIYLLSVVSIIGCSKSFTTLYCGPNKTLPVVIFKEQSNNLPSFVKEREVHLKSTIDLLGKIKLTDFDVNTQQKVLNFRDQLNNATSRTNDVLMSALRAYIAQPCNNEVSANYFKLLDKISTDLVKVLALENNINSLATKTNFDPKDSKNLIGVIDTYSNSTVFFLNP